MTEPTPTTAVTAAAVFLSQVLGLEGDHAEIAADLIRIGDEPPVSTFAVELDSAAGPAAFVVYAHELDAANASGVTGRGLLRTALETLAEAERRNSPGPRAVATAEVDRWGLILATTPDVFARLAGDNSEQRPANTPPEAPSTGMSRTDLAEALLASLRETNRLADAYLASRQAGPSASSAETELALYLTDSRSLASLLALVRRIVDDNRDAT